ncbi:MAG TPA: hypothetical protein VJ962_06060 [Clostridia bacterium]|nr:hypothetical protein [Clostridia bacterium]
MKINQITLSLKSVANDNKVRLIGIKDMYEYEDGKRTVKNGTKYVCLCESNEYEKIEVKVESIEPIITEEELEKKKEPVYISFQGTFKGIFWYKSRTSSWELSCKAEKVVLVKK